MKEAEAELLSKFFDVLSDSKRIIILHSIEEGMSIENIKVKFNVPLETVYSHLEILQDRGFIKFKEGKYHLTDEGKHICQWLNKIVPAIKEYSEGLEAWRKLLYFESVSNKILQETIITDKKSKSATLLGNGRIDFKSESEDVWTPNVFEKQWKSKFTKLKTFLSKGGLYSE